MVSDEHVDRVIENMRTSFTNKANRKEYAVTVATGLLYSGSLGYHSGRWTIEQFRRLLAAYNDICRDNLDMEGE